jgi:WD40 repeat protein
LLALVLATAATTEAGPRTDERPAQPYASRTTLERPRLFGEGVISTEDDEIGGTFSPDGRDLYFAKRTPSTIVSDLVVIMVSHFANGRWGRPQVAPFSGQYFDYSPRFSPDGSKLFFTSVRPVDGKPRADSDIWYVEKTRDGAWGEPRNLGAPVNTSGPDQNACVAADGTLYFASIRPGGTGNFDLYRSRLVDGRYAEPESLGVAVNTEAVEYQPYVAPDQSVLVFASLGRPDAALGAGSPYPRPDLYVSYNRDGRWTPAERLPAPIDTEATESYPFVSPDGRYLFFTSERNFTSIPMPRRLDYGALRRRLRAPGNGLGDLYQIDAGAIGVREPARRNR